MRTKTLIIAVALLLGACARQPPKPPPPTVVEPPPEPAHFEAFPGRGPQVVAALRAAPPPEQPEWVPGKTVASDQQMQIARGYVQIGSARYRVDEPAAQQQALEQGRAVGADKVVIYEHYKSDAGGAAPTEVAHEELLAVYYVLFKPPFGATFRDLKSDELLILGAGVEIGSVIGSTPAAEANLLAGDFVLKLNGRPVRNRADFEHLLRAHSGKAVTLTIHRNGQFFDRLVRLGSAPPQ